MTKTIEIKVTGTGDVPMDMLRYDAAWPASQEDARKMVLARYGTEEERAEWFTTPRDVFLFCHGKPTPERWASFGWRCDARQR